MGWKEATDSVFKNMNDYKGRASRAEYWWFQLVWMIAMVGVTIFQIIVLESIFSLYEISALLDTGLGYAAFAIFMSVSVRRMHDTNRSGIWYFMPFISLFVGLFVFVAYLDFDFWVAAILPVIFTIVFIVFAILPGDKNQNQYGLNPLLRKKQNSTSFKKRSFRPVNRNFDK